MHSFVARSVQSRTNALPSKVFINIDEIHKRLVQMKGAKISERNSISSLQQSFKPCDHQSQGVRGNRFGNFAHATT